MKKTIDAITSKAGSLGTTIWGDENSSRRALLSPFYYNPELTNWAIRNKTKIRNIRGGIFAVNGAGIFASHSIFFKSSFSITPKDKIDKIDGVILTQKQLDKLNEDKLLEIGGGKYQDYYNYFKDYNNPEGLHLKTLNTLTDKSFASEIAALKASDPTLGASIEKTINDQRDKIFTSRVTDFKKVNETHDPENFKKDSNYSSLDESNYDKFLIDHYKAKDPSLDTIEKAVAYHNSKYSYNPIYASKEDVPVDMAVKRIDFTTGKFSELIKFNNYHPFDLLTDKVGFGFLFAFQWFFTLLSAYGIKQATIVRKPTGAEGGAGVGLIGVQSSQSQHGGAGDLQILPPAPAPIPTEQAGFPPPLPAGASRIVRRGDNGANKLPQGQSLMSSTQPGFPPPPFQPPSGDGKVYGDGLIEQPPTHDSVLHVVDSFVPPPPPPGSLPEAQTMIRPDPIHTQLAESVLVSSQDQSRQHVVGMPELGNSAEDSLNRAGGGFDIGQSQGGTIRSPGRLGSNEDSPEQARGFLFGGEGLQPGAESQQGNYGPAGGMPGAGVYDRGQPHRWGPLPGAGQGEGWGSGEEGSYVRSQIRSVSQEGGSVHLQGLHAANISAAPPRESTAPGTRPQRTLQRGPVALRAQGSVVPAAEPPPGSIRR